MLAARAHPAAAMHARTRHADSVYRDPQLHLEVEMKGDVHPAHVDDATGAAAASVDDLPPPASALRRYVSDGGAPSTRGGPPPPVLGRQMSLATPSTATSQTLHSWKLTAPRRMNVASAAKGSTGYHLAVPLPHDEAALGAWLGPDPNVRAMTQSFINDSASLAVSPSHLTQLHPAPSASGLSTSFERPSGSFRGDGRVEGGCTRRAARSDPNRR